MRRFVLERRTDSGEVAQSEFRRPVMRVRLPDMFRPSLLGVVYLVVGIAVAASHHYLKNLDTLRLIGSAVLAVVLWPLLLLGIDLHITK